MDIKNLGTQYHTIDLITGTTTLVQVIFMNEVSESMDDDKENVTGFFNSPFNLTYYKPRKGLTKKQVIQEGIRQALYEGNISVIIDSA